MTTDSNSTTFPPSSPDVSAAAPREETCWSLLECSNEIFYRVTTDQGLMHGRVSYVSRGAKDLTGYSLEDFSQHPSLWASLIHPDDLQTVFATTAQMVTQVTALTREYRLKGKDGQYHWMEDRVMPLINEDGRLAGYQGVAADVTARKAAQASATAAQDRLHAVLETGRIGVWEWDLQAQQVLYSSEWSRQLGLGDAEIRATINLWEESLRPSDRQRVVGALHHALAGPGSRFSCSYRLVSQDELELFVLGSWSITRGEDGDAVRVLGVEVDLADHAEFTVDANRASAPFEG